MEIYGNRRTYNCFGGGAIYSFVGDLLTIRLGDYGTAVESIEITAYLRSRTRSPRPTLEDLFDQFHDYLSTLPKITFRRKLKRVEIDFLSEHFMAEDDEGWKPSAEKCNTSAVEIGEVLPLLKKRIKSADDFDVNRFLADCAEVLSLKIGSFDEWERIRKQAKEKRLAMRATKSPWELLEIDWDEYHPQAREILDDPFFWEDANDLAPNGNDTGADLLHDFRLWNKRNGNKSPLVFLSRLLKDWDIKPIDWSVTDDGGVRKLETTDPIALSVCNEAAIGLAFAVLKTRATCPPDMAQMALAALARTEFAVKRSSLSKETKAEWANAITKMRAKLKSLPPSK